MIILPEDRELMALLPPDEAKLVLLALFSEPGEEPELSIAAKIVVTAVRNKSDRITEKKKNFAEMQSEKGKRGGAPYGNKNAQKQPETTEQPETSQNNPEQPETSLTVPVTVPVTVPDTVTSNLEPNGSLSPGATPYTAIAEMFNRICISYPRIKKLSEARKRAIKARLNDYTVHDFDLLFKKAEESAFLKGKNENNWCATFDWLIADKNMAKVLDGNYKNRDPSSITGPPKKSALSQFEQREYTDEELAARMNRFD